VAAAFAAVVGEFFMLNRRCWQSSPLGARIVIVRAKIRKGMESSKFLVLFRQRLRMFGPVGRCWQGKAWQCPSL